MAPVEIRNLRRVLRYRNMIVREKKSGCPQIPMLKFRCPQIPSSNSVCLGSRIGSTVIREPLAGWLVFLDMEVSFPKYVKVDG